MKNERVILVNGMARGGTNIVWNLLQSHPSVCAPQAETGELLWFRSLPSRGKRLPRTVLTSRVTSSGPAQRIAGSIVDRVFFRSKLQSHRHPDSGEKAPGDWYAEDEVAKATLCLKSVNGDIFLTPFLKRIYPECVVVNVVRNGYAVCESWIRRGQTAREAGVRYRRYAREMLKIHAEDPRATLVRFEACLSDPFEVASALYRFAGLSPASLPQIRLKSKRVLMGDDRHEVGYGAENRKYWFTPETARQILNPHVDQIQASSLSPGAIQAFEAEAGDVLRQLHYARPREAAT